jgi:iron complex transport system substrate-binding protein
LLVITMTSGVADAVRMQERTQIPIYVLDIGLKNLPKAYEALGRLLGTESRAAELAEYCRAGIAEVETKVQTIPLKRRPRVYYANGPKGLETAPRGSLFSEPIDLAGGINVAQVSAVQVNASATVSLEHVLSWDPEIVIAAYGYMSHNSIWQDPIWGQVRAVRSHAVYEMPRFPFAWDRPFSASRILEIKWLAALFFPDVFRYDIKQETKNFYAKFYHHTPTEEELNELLAYSLIAHPR